MARSTTSVTLTSRTTLREVMCCRAATTCRMRAGR
jgi:hypothetical protein